MDQKQEFDITSISGRVDRRWICWKCADLDELDADGLCRDCQARDDRPTVEPLEPDAGPIVVDIPPSDPRWHCGSCGSLALLDNDDLCYHCRPERTVQWVQAAMRAVHGEPVERRRRWWID